MTRKKKQSRPYVMRGPTRPSARRPTVLDKADPRVPDQPVPKLSPARLRGIESDFQIDPRFRPVERCLMRWARGGADTPDGPGRATSVPLFSSQSDLASPLDDGEFRLVDAVIRSAPAWARQFVKLWYRRGAGVEEIQEELAIKRRQQVYEERAKVLSYFLGRLVGAGFEITSRRDVVEG